MRLPGIKRYVTARAVIVREGKMLAFHRRRRNVVTGVWNEYFSIPGGEIDEGETPEEAVVRELQEEMGVIIEPGKLIGHHISNGFEHYVFSAKIVSGIPTFMTDSQEAIDYMSADNQYDVVWVPVADLTEESLKFYGPFYNQILSIAASQTNIKPD